jgi:hypothetical protein
MKKIMVLFSLIGISVSCAFGQTYYYKHTETIDQNGAKSRGKGGRYYTFSGNSFYESDKDGYKKNFTYMGRTFLAHIYVLSEEGANVDAYVADACQSSCGTYYGSNYDWCCKGVEQRKEGRYSNWGYIYKYDNIIRFVSKWTSDGKPKEIEVYERSSGPESERGPANFY